MVMLTSRYVLCFLFTAAVVWAGGNKGQRKINHIYEDPDKFLQDPNESHVTDEPPPHHEHGITGALNHVQYGQVLNELEERLKKRHQRYASPGGKPLLPPNGNQPPQLSGGKKGGQSSTAELPHPEKKPLLPPNGNQLSQLSGEKKGGQSSSEELPHSAKGPPKPRRRHRIKQSSGGDKSYGAEAQEAKNPNTNKSIVHLMRIWKKIFQHVF